MAIGAPPGVEAPWGKPDEPLGGNRGPSTHTKISENFSYSKSALCVIATSTKSLPFLFAQDTWLLFICIKLGYMIINIADIKC